MRNIIIKSNKLERSLCEDWVLYVRSFSFSCIGEVNANICDRLVHIVQPRCLFTKLTNMTWRISTPKIFAHRTCMYLLFSLLHYLLFFFFAPLHPQHTYTFQANKPCRGSRLVIRKTQKYKEKCFTVTNERISQQGLLV